MTLREAADTLGVRVKTVRNLLARDRAAYGPPQYVPGARGPVRVLRAADVAGLQTALAAWRQARAAPAASSSGSPASSRDS